jgi:hypothetical protein
MPTGVMSDLWREKSAFTHFPKLILEAKRRIKVPISKHMDGDDSMRRGKVTYQNHVLYIYIYNTERALCHGVIYKPKII